VSGLEDIRSCCNACRQRLVVQSCATNDGEARSSGNLPVEGYQCQLGGLVVSDLNWYENGSGESECRRTSNSLSSASGHIDHAVDESLTVDNDLDTIVSFDVEGMASCLGGHEIALPLDTDIFSGNIWNDLLSSSPTEVDDRVYLAQVWLSLRRKPFVRVIRS